MEPSTFNQKSLAAELNLSTATVSKSLRNHPDIAPETRARVLELASRRGYQSSLRPTDSSSSAARAKGRAQQMRFVGVLMYDRTGPSGVDASGTGYLAGLSEASRAYNTSLIVHRFSGDSRQLLDLEYQPAALREGILEGLILIHRFEPEVVVELAKRHPVVTLTHYVHGQMIDHIDVNHGGAIARLVDEMYNQGHRRFGYLGRLPELAYNQTRFGSFAASMSRLGMPLNHDALLNVFHPLADLDAAAEAMARQIEKG